MRPNTRSTKRALGPAVTRLPPNVLELIFGFNCDQPKVINPLQSSVLREGGN